jgi:hypothetical protein
MAFDPFIDVRHAPSIIVGSRDLRTLRALVERHAGGPTAAFVKQLDAVIQRHRCSASAGPGRGPEGNTDELLGIAARNVPAGVETRDLVLATYDGSVETLAEELRNFLRRFIGGKARVS